MASIGGDLPEHEQKSANEIIKSFGEKVRKYALALQVPASLLKVQQCTFLFVAKDTASFHFVFADAPGSNSLNYRNLSAQGRLELQSLVHQVRIEVGEVAWAFSCPLNVALPDLEDYIQTIVQQYVNSVLQSQRKPSKNISSEAVSMPEIASGLEKFRADYPIGKKTAFIIMQFGNTTPHQLIVTCIKDTLRKHGITALRADDKEYMDDLFPNIKTYMHACDFGVAVYDRITEDDFNPNVSLEVGYMLGMGKNVLLLKDKTLKSLQTDLTGKLYKAFDTTDIDKTMPQHIEKWLSDRGFG
ncbi:MAG: nucleotide-binding protein [Geobacteraceae bacterium]|nr:nucleotide-binding protein [Geobacteraceae bacterium]